MTAPPRTRRSPGVETRATSTPPSDITNFSLYRAVDGFVAPTADGRREAALLAELRTLGYGITGPCLMCRRPLTAARSLETHVGPVCAARSGVTR